MKTPENILIIIDHLGPGGYQRQTKELVTHLPLDRFKPTILTYHSFDHFLPERSGVATICIPKSQHRGVIQLNRVVHLVKMILFIKRNKFRIIQAMGGMANFYAAILKRFSSGAKLVTREGSGSWSKVNRFEKYAYRHADFVITNYREALERMDAELGIKPGKSSILYNGININNYPVLDHDKRSSIRSSLGLADDHFTFFIAARLEPQKNFLGLFNALNLLPFEMRHKIRVLCAGRGYNEVYDQMIRKRSQEMGLDEIVNFLGPRKDIPDLLAACDCGLLPSLYEGLSNFVLECHAAHRPVICTLVGDSAKAVLHNESGWLIPPGDDMALRDAILHCATIGRDGMLHYGKQGYQHVIKHFSIEEMISQYCQIYERLLQ